MLTEKSTYILTVYSFTPIIKEKVLQLLFAINWSRLFKEILLLMLLYGGAFFEKRGNKTVKEQQVERQGIFLTNYVMIKDRLATRALA